MTTEITPQQAIGLLDSAVSQMQLSRAQHADLVSALQTLANASGLNPQAAPEDCEPECPKVD